MTLMLRIQSTLHCLRMHRQPILCIFSLRVLFHSQQHQRVSNRQPSFQRARSQYSQTCRSFKTCQTLNECGLHVS